MPGYVAQTWCILTLRNTATRMCVPLTWQAKWQMAVSDMETRQRNNATKYNALYVDTYVQALSATRQRTIYWSCGRLCHLHAEVHAGIEHTFQRTASRPRNCW